LQLSAVGKIAIAKILAIHGGEERHARQKKSAGENVRRIAVV
jgi:hypothetical protein